MATITRKGVEKLAAAYVAAQSEWGDNNLITQRAEIRYSEAKQQYASQRAKEQQRRAGRRDAMDSIGMKRVRGNLGGTYYE